MFRDDGGLQPFGQVHERVAGWIDHAELDDLERLVLRELYGIDAFPVDLAAGPGQLVGRISTTTSRQSVAASRSTIAAARTRGVAAFASVVNPAPMRASMPLRQVADPAIDPKLNVLIGGDVDVRQRLFEAAVYCAHDLVDRAEHAADLRSALGGWAVRHVDVVRRPRLSAGQRRALATGRSQRSTSRCGNWRPRTISG